MVKLSMRMSKPRALRFKAHLYKEHPMTRGKIKITK